MPGQYPMTCSSVPVEQNHNTDKPSLLEQTSNISQQLNFTEWSWSLEKEQQYYLARYYTPVAVLFAPLSYPRVFNTIQGCNGCKFAPSPNAPRPRKILKIGIIIENHGRVVSFNEVVQVNVIHCHDEDGNNLDLYTSDWKTQQDDIHEQIEEQ
ncbi:hypothetical protein NEOLI_003770 [Neolecta irregularis DAH-3]|uniref:Uncharacterized protein n=1 Tax=Neolecta irregularis (strain DAH-3) TaxID=1198029 RepID=A0A1U7LT19_NEOID|nr:hypothetical protein NEOLI_003770 [Neolecta irregularis DAH-3]|eukprot:OLL25807.1 hypothetical protein NEOLI_003770 [Neolecta irregularis DAH-3]